MRSFCCVILIICAVSTGCSGPRTTSWEYKTFWVESHGATADRLEDRLRPLGEEGWELVSVTCAVHQGAPQQVAGGAFVPATINGHLVAVLKKPKQ